MSSTASASKTLRSSDHTSSVGMDSLSSYWGASNCLTSTEVSSEKLFSPNSCFAVTVYPAFTGLSRFTFQVLDLSEGCIEKTLVSLTLFSASFIVT